MAVVNRVERWRLGLDVEFPEYNAYWRRPARIRASAIAALVAAGAVIAAIALTGGLSHSRASTEPVTTPPRPGVAPAPTRSVSHRSATVTHGTATGRPSSPLGLYTGRGDTTAPSNEPGQTAAALPVTAVVLRTAIPAVQQVDTRHTSPIPSTAIAGAA
jgi:hypothetical protein